MTGPHRSPDLGGRSGADHRKLVDRRRRLAELEAHEADLEVADALAPNPKEPAA